MLLEPSPALDPAFLARPLAHRALHDRAAGRPENSLAAVRAAVRAGYGIEIDVQMSRDGRAMVFHDYDLGRLTKEVGAVQLRDAAVLGQIALRDGEGQTIPTLEQVLAQIAGAVPVVIEIKDQDGALGPDVGRLEAAVVQAVHAYTGPVAVMSFNPHSVAWFGHHAPWMARGLVSDRFEPSGWPAVPKARLAALRPLPDVARLGVGFISHHWESLGDAPVRAARARGLPVLC
ncbi:MAG: glycerophosphodiester phosphodiesterase family protein, partial [Paracoccaceae bacterium]